MFLLCSRPFDANRTMDGGTMGQLKRDLIESEHRARRPITLGDLVAIGIDVFYWCNRCGHHGAAETAPLVGTHGPDCAVPEIGSRLRCAGCGAKDIATRPAWLAAAAELDE
jgi:hypothetical protein